MPVFAECYGLSLHTHPQRELYTDREELAQSHQFETTQPKEESRKIIVTVVPNSRIVREIIFFYFGKLAAARASKFAAKSSLRRLSNQCPKIRIVGTDIDMTNTD